MLKIQSVNHVSEHLSAIYPVYTLVGRDGIPPFGAYRGEDDPACKVESASAALGVPDSADCRPVFGVLLRSTFILRGDLPPALEFFSAEFQSRHWRPAVNCLARSGGRHEQVEGLRLAARHGTRSRQLLPAQQSPPEPGRPAIGKDAKPSQALRLGAAPG